MTVETKKIIFHIRQTLRYLLILLGAAQILMGLVWILCNISFGCAHERTAIYMEAAAGGALDDYTGVLYPLIIRMVRLLTEPLGMSFEPAIYLLQLAGAVVGCTIFWQLSCASKEKLAWKRWEDWGRGLLLVTIPLCAQWHLTILPNSLTASIFMVLLGHVIHLYRFQCYEEKKWLIRIGLLWGVLILLMPEYLYLALPPVALAVWGAICSRKPSEENAKAKARAVILILLPIVLALTATGVNRAIQQPGSTGKIQNSFPASMVSRFVWPHFGTHYFFWPDEIKAVMTEEEGALISVYPDQVQTVFGPMVEAVYSRERANDYYLQMALNCLQYRTTEVMTAVLEDFAAYLNPLWMVREQLEGYGLSHTGYLYDKMREHTPAITTVYVQWGLVAFRAALAVAVVCGVFSCIVNCKQKKRNGIGPVVMLAGCVLLHALWYTLSGAGMMEYGYSCVVQMLWYYGIGRLMKSRRERAEECDTVRYIGDTV